MVQRSRASRFAPGFVVFPGGVVEPGDVDLADAWFGARHETSRACAVRELAEETGLVLTADGPVRTTQHAPPLLSQPAGHHAGLAPPALEQLPEVARWVAPEFLPVRFDARFFAVLCGPGVEPVADGLEVERAWWSAASVLLEAQASGRAQLMWPTLKMLEALSGCRSVADVLALRVEQMAPPAGGAPSRA
jgi:8-oxo-dGTP pyrophosphatase MutT (NUDIX family)